LYPTNTQSNSHRSGTLRIRLLALHDHCALLTVGGPSHQNIHLTPPIGPDYPFARTNARLRIHHLDDLGHYAFEGPSLLTHRDLTSPALRAQHQPRASAPAEYGCSAPVPCRPSIRS